MITAIERLPTRFVDAVHFRATGRYRGSAYPSRSTSTSSHSIAPGYSVAVSKRVNWEKSVIQDLRVGDLTTEKRY